MWFLNSGLFCVIRHKSKLLAVFRVLGFFGLYLNMVIQLSWLVITFTHPLEIRSFIVRGFFSLHALAVIVIHHICFAKRNKVYAVLSCYQEQKVHFSSCVIYACALSFVAVFIALFPTSINDSYEPELFTRMVPTTITALNTTYALTTANQVTYVSLTLTYIVNSMNLMFFMSTYNAQIGCLKVVRDQVKRFIERGKPGPAFSEPENIKTQLLACMRNIGSLVNDYSTAVAFWSIDFYGNITLPVVWIAISRNQTMNFTGLIINSIYSFTSFVVFTETSYRAGNVQAELDDLLGQIVLTSPDKTIERELFATKETFRVCQTMLTSAGINTVNRQFLTNTLASTFNIAIILYQVVPKEAKENY